jgi:hypothetical protein
MTSEVQIFGKDKIKLNILQDVLAGLVNVTFQLNNGTAQDYASQIHAEGKRVNVLGKFNISEDANDGDTITIRPIMIDAPLKIGFHANANFSGKKASVVRNATKTVEQEFEISSETDSIELIPQGKQSYLLKVSNGGGFSAEPIQSTSRPSQQKTDVKGKPKNTPQNAHQQASQQFDDFVPPTREHTTVDDRFDGFELGTETIGGDNRFESFDVDPIAVVSETVPKTDFEPAEEIATRTKEQANYPDGQNARVDDPQEDDRDLSRIAQEISVIERQQGQLSRKKQSAIDHLEKIEAEYKKDYASFEQELEDYKSRLEADASIIEHYKDQDVMPIEIVFQEIRLKLDDAEEQIRFFIEAKQRKTMEIENEIKSNKKQ